MTWGRIPLVAAAWALAVMFLLFALTPPVDRLGYIRTNDAVDNTLTVVSLFLAIAMVLVGVKLL